MAVFALEHHRVAAFLAEGQSVLQAADLCFTSEYAVPDRALALRPGYVEALYNRGVVLQDSRRYEDAVQTFARLLDIAPDCRYAAGKLH
jgi:tetratricopeptide (TPR) repeat protein